MWAVLCCVASTAFYATPAALRVPSTRPAVTMQEAPQKPSLEEVTEKYGLEAGLFNAIKDSAGSSDGNDGGEGGDAKSKMATAGDLLKRYGGAYLLTSTSLAVVSFSLCYAAVSNGVDVAALISNIPGIEVSDNAETAGTVGLAYAIHKAASPIRFPPTVALTPIVAKNVFGKDEAAAEGE